MNAIPRQINGRAVRCCDVEGHHVKLSPLSLLPTRLLLISDPHQQDAFRVHQTEELLQKQSLTPGGEPWEMLLIVPQTFFFFLKDYQAALADHEPFFAGSFFSRALQQTTRPMGH